MDKLPILYVGERKAKSPAYCISIDNDDRRMYWKDLQCDSVAVKEPQNRSSFHAPNFTEDEADVLRLGYNYKEKSPVEK